MLRWGKRVVTKRKRSYVTSSLSQLVEKSVLRVMKSQFSGVEACPSVRPARDADYEFDVSRQGGTKYFS